MQAPSLVMNTGESRQQVPLRDYLNTRLAPFLKKAITESLGVEAEYPLQWLGECLINHSILYEGNPDPTNIQERFRYSFDAPPSTTQDQPGMNGVVEGGVPESEQVQEPAVNGEKVTDEEQKPEATQGEVQPPQPPAAQDIDMGGTV